MGLRALVVDDEPDLARLLSYNLGAAGFAVAVAHAGEAALTEVVRQIPHVVVLDLCLPDVHGFEVCRRLRAHPRTAKVGVLMITAVSLEAGDRVHAFEAGADDFVAKPFDTRELVLRAQAVARRANVDEPTSDLLVCGAVTIDRAAKQVFVDSAPVELRHLEILLLEHLIANRGRAHTRRDLLAAVWKIRRAANARIVDVTVSRLRENLGAAGDLIETIPGLGYRIKRPPE